MVRRPNSFHDVVGSRQGNDRTGKHRTLYSMSLLLRNGRILSCNSGQIVETNWLHAEGGRVKSTGCGDPPRDTECGEILDLEGRTVLPGLADSHLHIYALGKATLSVNLEGCKSIEELQSRAQKHEEGQATGSAGSNRYLEGHGWDQDLLGRYPTRWGSCLRVYLFVSLLLHLFCDLEPWMSEADAENIGYLAYQCEHDECFCTWCVWPVQTHSAADTIGIHDDSEMNLYRAISYFRSFSCWDASNIFSLWPLPGNSYTAANCFQMITVG